MRLFLAALTLVMASTPAGAQWLDRKTPGLDPGDVEEILDEVLHRIRGFS